MTDQPLLADQVQQQVNDFFAQRQEYVIHRKEAHAASVAQTEDKEILRVFVARESLKLRSKRAGVTLANFRIIRELGRGAFSKVYLVQHKTSKKLFALKSIRKSRVSGQDGAKVRTERAVMLHFKSQFIVQLHFAFQDDQHLYFVMDYAAGGDLSGLLNSCGSLPEWWARVYFCQMLSAVLLLHNNSFLEICGLKSDYNVNQQFTTKNESCSTPTMEGSEKNQTLKRQFSHSKLTKRVKEDSETTDTPIQRMLPNDSREMGSSYPDTITFAKKKNKSLSLSFEAPKPKSKEENIFIHRDLKPQNFLLNQAGQVLLADFGLAKECTEQSLMKQSMTSSAKLVGTLHYISPEQFKTGFCGKCVDYWALGCILYEMLLGEVAFSKNSIEEFISYMQNTPFNDIKPDYENGFQDLSPDAQDLVQGLLDPPENRLGRRHMLKRLVLHPFLTKGYSVQDILQLNTPELRKLQLGDVLNPDELGNLPLIPYEAYLKHLPSPWWPKVKDELLLNNDSDVNVDQLSTSEETQSSALQLNVDDTQVGRIENPFCSPHLQTSMRLNTFSGINFVGADVTDEQLALSHANGVQTSSDFELSGANLQAMLTTVRYEHKKEGFKK